jgi:tRNA A-37 threonylcarbamoyl transferase component Bud32
MFKKTIIYSEKRGLSETKLEVELQTVASKYGFCPKISSVKFSNTGCEIMMDHIKSPCLADMYGDQPSALPAPLWSKIHHIVSTLYEQEGIIYVDITPYNFIEHEEKVYIIDFGDAYYKGTRPRNWFHEEFLANPCSWNPDFA